MQKCSQETDELADTARLFQTPFPVEPDATYYGNNTPSLIRYFKQRLGLSPVASPNCGVFAFFTGVRDPFVRSRRPPFCR